MMQPYIRRRMPHAELAGKRAAQVVCACWTLLVLLSSTVVAEDRAVSPQAALRVGVAPEMPPMVYKEGKKIVGVEADFAQAIGRSLNRPVTFVELAWADLIDSLEEGKIDIIMSSMSITRARSARIAFSQPYLRIGQMALVRAEDKFSFPAFGRSISSRTLGVKQGTTADLLVLQEYPKAKRKYYASGDEAAKALLKKKIDLYFSDSTMIWYLAGKYEAEGLVPAPSVFSDETLAWGMRRSDQELLNSVNQELKRMTETGEMSRILKRWIPKFE